MNTYNVVVTVSTTVCIDAESPDDAIEKVSQALNNGDVNMSTDIANNIGYDLDDGDRIMVDDSLYDDALDAFDEYDIEYEEV